MKTIGLIGGMSWESTLEYYRIINETVKKKMGGLNSAKCLIYSFNFADIECLQTKSKWDISADVLTDAANRLQRAGADFLLICTNTMHKVYDQIKHKIDIPILHIADATGELIKRDGYIKVGLLGTKFTMQENFYRNRLVTIYGLDVIVPEESEQDQIHQIIYDELCLGEVREESRDIYLEIINRLMKKNVQCIILGCTEIGMLLSQNDCEIPLYDTTLLHALHAVEIALQD